MKRLLLLSLLLAATAGASPVEKALSKNPAIAKAGIAELRAQGQAGVDALVAAIRTLEPDGEVVRARLVLDQVCRQRDCYASRLYWFTDLGAAKAEARKRNKPILSVRLLGNLDDDFSCANSRFFRTTLYSNPRIAAAMREQFVLHWSSERPVPKVTIDFGDGRTLKQTITGNSIHYLLDADGRPLDALPGLYAPDRFLAKINELATFAASLRPETRNAQLISWHQQGALNAYTSLSAQLNPPEATVSEKPRKAAAPAAVVAMPIAVTKRAVEMPLLSNLGQRVPDARWKELAAKEAPQVRFAPESIALMKEKYGATDAMLVTLQQSVAEDTLRNEYDLHVRLHQWFLADRTPTFNALNKRVYAELFLTPRSDPWLGLQPTTFTAAPST